MIQMTIEKAAQACGGVLTGTADPSREIGRVVIDSRLVRDGDLFVAYKGQTSDGHDYISAALDNGAAVCLAERVPPGENRAIILTDDVQTALERIMTAYRDSLSLPIIGVTGSVGKTTTKEMICAVLSAAMNVLKTEGNLNNYIGVPMTLSRITPDHRAAVIEMGISEFGEMTRLGNMVRPRIVVFTLIGHAHLEYLGDLDGVLKAKTEILELLDEDACVILNGDDAKLKAFPCPVRRISYGLGNDCDVRAENVVSSESATVCDIVCGARRIKVTVPAFGSHLVYAALAAAAVGLELGLSDIEIAEGIGSFAVVGRRAAVSHTGKITLIDDCYNSNPDALKSGIDSLMKLPGRHICVLGDMLELGDDSPDMHFECGRYARDKGVDVLYCCGNMAGYYRDGAGDIATCCADIEQLVLTLKNEIMPGDCVLVKASRGAHFEQISEALKTL